MMVYPNFHDLGDFGSQGEQKGYVNMYLWTANKNLLVLNKKIQERFLQALQFLNMFWILSK